MELSKKSKAIELHEKATIYFRTSEHYGYKFLMETKIIREEKLFKELGYSSFDDYTKQNFDYSSRTINERIQVAETWGEDYERALALYGQHRTRQLGLMPEDERIKVIEEGVPTDEGTKSVDEATTREIENYQKQLKEKDAEIDEAYALLVERDQKLAMAKRSEELAIQQLEEYEDRPAETVIQEVEVIPDDYEKLKQENAILQQSYNELVEMRKETDEKSAKYDELTEAINSSQSQLQDHQERIANYKNTLNLLRKANNAIIEASPASYLEYGDVVFQDEAVKTEFNNLIYRLEKLTNDLKAMAAQGEILEGEIIND